MFTDVDGKNKLLDITIFFFFFFLIITDFIISYYILYILFILHNQWKFILEGLLYAS